MQRSLVAGWRCLVCGAHVDVGEPLAWRCPNSSAADRRHELAVVAAEAPLTDPGLDQAEAVNPFLAFREHLVWDGFAAANGMTAAARAILLDDLDQRVAAVAGTGFRITPFARHEALSAELGFTTDGGVWVKDETGNVGGSHKARHLFTILAQLVTLESLGRAPWASTGRPDLAIASCGNAAVAAATLAAAVGWPIRVFVPEWAGGPVMSRLTELQATVVTCPRRPEDPPGDPCVLRFREAVAAGAIPFSVQGPENAWCLDGGRTIGWEMATQIARLDASGLDHVVVQVGAGALAACAAAGLRAGGIGARIHAMQTEACAPLERAWRRAADAGGADHAADRWAACMWPWEPVGQTAADGIVDDETYDWLPVVEAMATTGGGPVVSQEHDVLRGWQLVRDVAGIDASATGAAGVAGLLTLLDRGAIDPDQRVAVIVSGVQRR